MSTKKIYVAGHKGMVGSAICRQLSKNRDIELITANREDLDLISQSSVEAFLSEKKPDIVIIAAAKVGGILANNNYKAQFIYENLMIQTNLIHSSYLVGVKKLIFLGSSCIYPKYSKQPISEKYLLSGKLEKTNDAYAVAKISGIKMCQAYNKQYKTNYICLMPTNLYGPNDNYNLKSSHFFPALINKIHQAKSKKKKSITLWGDGTPMREIMFVDDLADACEFFLKKKTKFTLINIGSGTEKSILGYANFLLKRMNINLKINFDKRKPNGTPRKKLNFNLAKKYGWKSKTSLAEGFKITYDDFIKNKRYK